MGEVSIERDQLKGGTVRPLGDRRDESRDRQHLQSSGPAAEFRPDSHRHREPGKNPVLVLWGDQEARDDQLPHLQAGARRAVLRAHLRPGEGLRVLVRQVQAHEVQGRHLREVRRRGDARQGPARAHGPYRARGARRPYLVPEVAALAHRPSARHDAEGPRARALFRELHRARAGAHLAQAAAAPLRGGLSQGAGGFRRGFLHRIDRCRGHSRAAQGSRSREARGRFARRDRRVRPQSSSPRSSPSGSRWSRPSSSRATSPSG